MARTTSRSAPRRSSRTVSVAKRSREAYSQALREAGVTEEELRLLRELADTNANELGSSTVDMPRSRVFL